MKSKVQGISSNQWDERRQMEEEFERKINLWTSKYEDEKMEIKKTNQIIVQKLYSDIINKQIMFEKTLLQKEKEWMKKDNQISQGIKYHSNEKDTEIDGKQKAIEGWMSIKVKLEKEVVDKDMKIELLAKELKESAIKTEKIKKESDDKDMKTEGEIQKINEKYTSTSNDLSSLTLRYNEWNALHTVLTKDLYDKSRTITSLTEQWNESVSLQHIWRNENERIIINMNEANQYKNHIEQLENTLQSNELKYAKNLKDIGMIHKNEIDAIKATMNDNEKREKEQHDTMLKWVQNNYNAELQSIRTEAIVKAQEQISKNEKEMKSKSKNDVEKYEKESADLIKEIEELKLKNKNMSASLTEEIKNMKDKLSSEKASIESKTREEINRWNFNHTWDINEIHLKLDSEISKLKIENIQLKEDIEELRKTRMLKGISVSERKLGLISNEINEINNIICQLKNVLFEKLKEDFSKDIIERIEIWLSKTQILSNELQELRTDSDDCGVSSNKKILMNSNKDVKEESGMKRIEKKGSMNKLQPMSANKSSKIIANDKHSKQVNKK